MITVKDKRNCCGCGACANACPVRCVTMREDGKGFLYPSTDSAKCVHCGLCEKVCFSLGKAAVPTGQVIRAFGCYTRDEETRRNSSSGGIFCELARRTIARGGCVFGVAMAADCKSAVFSRAETESELQKLMTSKYLQAVTGDVFQEVESVLKTGREVLFSGTPCHINALQFYLRRSSPPPRAAMLPDGVSEYDNLLCVDVICHGTPSPKVWRAYVEEFERARNAALVSVSFRCKEESWRKFGMSLQDRGTHGSDDKLFIPADRDPYMKLFLSNYTLRLSCYACASKTFRLSDITLGDFWGVEKVLPKLDDAKGTTLALIRTEKGQRIFDSIRSSLQCSQTSYQDAIRDNYPEYKSVPCPLRRGEFFQNADILPLAELCKKYIRLSPYRRVRTILSVIWKKMPWGGV